MSSKMNKNQNINKTNVQMSEWVVKLRLLFVCVWEKKEKQEKFIFICILLGCYII